MAWAPACCTTAATTSTTNSCRWAARIGWNWRANGWRGRRRASELPPPAFRRGVSTLEPHARAHCAHEAITVAGVLHAGADTGLAIQHVGAPAPAVRSEENTSEIQPIMRI